MSLIDYTFKTFLVGDFGVGKTSLLLRFADDVYSESSASCPIDVDFVCWHLIGLSHLLPQKVRTIELGSKTAKLLLWDTAGREQYKSISSSYFRGCHGIIVVYDCTSAESFSNVGAWFAQIDRLAADDVNKLLVGNKSDLVSKKVISSERGQDMAKEFGVSFFETSAKAGTNVEQSFLTITQQIKNRLEKPVSDQPELDPSLLKTLPGAAAAPPQ